MRPNCSLFDETLGDREWGLSRRSRRFDLPRAEIVISHGRANHLVREFEGPVFLIGASSDCDLVLGDPSFPAVHTYLYLTAQGIRLRRLGVPPEIRVNGRVVDVAMLETGDRIDLDPFRFRIRIRQRRFDNNNGTTRWCVPDC